MNFLLIDNHPLILVGYVAILQKRYQGAMFYKCSTIAEVTAVLNSGVKMDVVVMDCNIGSPKQRQVSKGIEWIRAVKQANATAKIILITSHSEILFVYHIHKQVLPDGLLIKSEVSLDVLRQALEVVLTGGRFYSDEVVLQVDKMNRNTLMREQRNMQILLFLSQGYRAREISELLFISEAAVHRRIALMKKNFRATDSTGLIKIALNKGFV
ncbi:response regulator [Flavobacterium sp. JP2137]|uniref:response regulator n=1 Tax=Flavobacterium sp. JP2137 TaxID=3414510 RepID=UPI003D2FC508